MKLFRRMNVITLVTLMLINVFGGFAGQVNAEDWDAEDLASIEHITNFVDDGQTLYSDEEFYGQYDENTQQWIHPGYLAYDKYEGLLPVQEAAKEGNYAVAKEELLEFHRELYKLYSPAYTSTTPTTRQLYSAYAIKNNFQLNTFMVPAIWGIPALSDEWQVIEIDITDRMPTILAQAEPVISTELFGLKKDGTSLEFESINAGGDHPPVVEVTSKGVVQTITATDDATISPEDNYKTNYGLEPVLKAEESVSSIGLSRLADSNTKRSLIKFDFSSVDASTMPTKAVLKLYGRNASGVGSGELLAIEYTNNAWDEETVTFYEGRPGSTMEHATFSNYGEDTFLFDGGVAPDMDGGTSVFAYRYPEELLRFSWATVLGQLYAYEQDEEYALTFLDQWVGYLEQRGNTPRYDKTLDAHVRDLEVLKILSVMIDSEYLTPDIWSSTMKYFQMEARAQIDGGNDVGNWGVYQINGMAAIATYAPDLSIYDELIQVLYNWSEAKIEEAFYTDGSAHEIEWSYAFTSTFNQLLDANYLLQNGITDDSIFPDTVKEQGQKIMKYFASFLLPGGGNPQVGDGTGYTANSYAGKTRNARLNAAFDIPFWQWLGSNGAEGEMPDWTTIRFTGSSDPDEFLTGVYISRTDWSDKALYMYTDVDGNMTPGHGHQDDNQMIVKAYGQYLLVDNSYSSYANNRVPLDSTMYHNTVTIDGTTQSMEKTSWELSQTEPVEKEKRYETNYLYDNFTLMTPQNADNFGLHTRNTLFNRTGGFWIVNDYLEPEKEDVSHLYWQHWHMLPSANPSMSNGGTGRSNFSNSANIQIAQADMEGVEATVENGYFGGGTGVLYDSHYLRYEKNASGITTFNTVIYPERLGETADVSAYEYDLQDVTDDGAIAMNISITSDAGTYVDADYYLVHDPDQQQERTFGSYQTDGRSTYINRDITGKVAEVFVQDTSKVTDITTGTVLFQSSSPVAELGYKKEGSKLTISSSQDIDLENMTLYMEKISDIRQVEVNGQNVDFKTSGRYIYFGNSPILTDTEYNPEPDKNNNTGGSTGSGAHASGSGAGGRVPGTSNPGSSVTPPIDSDDELDDNNTGDDSIENIPAAFQEELSNHWGTEELTQAVREGILQGLDETTLGLDETTTRAQFVTLLVRALNLDLVEYSDSFQDVSAESWYASYIQTAFDAGLINGIDESIFAPEEAITREEMAKLLALAYQRITGIEELEAEPSGYADEEEISDWAKPYVDFTKKVQILLGDEDNRFRPVESATRAEAAVSVLRMKQTKM
ncbi:S-layer homology domain-containing protein [Ructibacterium gallinarum]|uniref:S-layer homology domain-containing protein n=1 Tax=Ructibacterium gallinarum TaxID=2779355 RepID=A0A9D5LZJ4_9FIRM|nr:S-layer homology domain-containing protein [Ructibacterium gallinarum]MBE5040953.1 S-layer homology domain-containing protein [Ructibacterium gallinarum]